MPACLCSRERVDALATIVEVGAICAELRLTKLAAPACDHHRSVLVLYQFK